MRLLAYLVTLALISIANVVQAKTYVLLTVDVETMSTGNPAENIWGDLVGYDDRYGVPKIIEILDRNTTKGTFYLNVYEIAKYGENDIKTVAQTIVAMKHDLQLHTHPGSTYEEQRLSNYRLSEQEEILKTGMQLIHEWTGQTVVAHRAGAFKANLNTIKALEQAGFILDSSLSPASNSPLHREGFSANDMIEINNILEIPITYYSQLRFGGLKSVRFLDIESTSLAEFKNILSAFSANDTCVVNIMMHSFSITRYGYPDKRVIDKLDSLLKFINNRSDLEAISTSSFIDSHSNNSLSCTPSPTFVPHTGVLLTYLRSWERFGDGWKNIVVALGAPGTIIFILTIGLTIRRRRRTCNSTGN